MGFLRKSFIVGTGGMGGLVVKGNSKKERIAKAAEKQLALQRQALREEQAVRAAEAAAQLREKIQGGQWWLDPSVFKHVGTVKTRYLGGLSAFSPVYEPRKLSFQTDGISFGAGRRGGFKILWPIKDLAIEDNARSSTRPLVKSSLDRVAHGPTAFILVVRSRFDEEALFLVDALSEEQLQKRLLPVSSRLMDSASRASDQHELSSPPTPQALVDGHNMTTKGVADELSKLASLRDRGILTEMEFQAQKARLLS